MPSQRPTYPSHRPSGLYAPPSSGKTLPLPHCVSKQPGCEMAEICRRPPLVLLPSPPSRLCSSHCAFPLWATRGRAGASFLLHSSTCLTKRRDGLSPVVILDSMFFGVAHLFIKTFWMTLTPAWTWPCLTLSQGSCFRARVFIKYLWEVDLRNTLFRFCLRSALRLLAGFRKYMDGHRDLWETIKRHYFVKGKPLVISSSSVQTSYYCTSQ